ncbi:Abaecin [Eufriesea mexicana]|uniref:Abaecin n=1 Tax=Eufriesea mexicana TaxID=516756 RepID=A0A310SCU0_9HYME|nr:PREDICTED: abaecin-like [Eufriesea mexicana]XP_017760993.1 PREDICTED: abaecin-like [Eufriesea mexicana]OAD54698.1 Abaecin [Eufriesea mexicana]
MKVIMFIFAILAMACASLAFVPTMPTPGPRGRPFPTFPGQGPFNPRQHWPVVRY